MLLGANVLILEAQSDRCWLIWLLVRALFLVCLFSPHVAERDQLSNLSSYKVTNPIMAPHPYDLV